MVTHEQTPSFTKGETVLHAGREAVILTVSTDCPCCDRFLTTTEYSVIDVVTKEVSYKVKQNLIDYKLPEY